MKGFSIVVLVFACVNAARAQGEAELHLPVAPNAGPGFAQSIVNGKQATATQFPWQALIKMPVSDTSYRFCGGSLIARNWILTAAHCAIGMSSFNVSMGSINNKTPTMRLVSNVAIVHEGYDPNTLANDLALIKLPQDMTLSKTVAVIRLPTIATAAKPLTNLAAFLSGFGQVVGGSIPNYLQFTEGRVISNEQCALTYGTAVITPPKICVVGSPNPNQSTCYGDSGGPLAAKISTKWTLIGVVSFVSSKGCDSGAPSGYMRTSSYLNWINEKTGIPIA